MTSTSGQTGQTIGQSNHGDYTVQIDYGKQTKLALWQGRPVNIMSLGNQAGRSPAFMCIDEQGQVAIGAVGDFTLLDLELLPPTVQQVERLLNTALQGQTSLR